jgi:hypothetical protein
MRETSGVILNDEIFINSSNITKILKKQITALDYSIEIYTLCDNDKSPIILFFKNENDRDVIFDKIIMELYGLNYSRLEFETK